MAMLRAYAQILLLALEYTLHMHEDEDEDEARGRRSPSRISCVQRAGVARFCSWWSRASSHDRLPSPLDTPRVAPVRGGRLL